MFPIDMDQWKRYMVRVFFRSKASDSASLVKMWIYKHEIKKPNYL